MFTPKGVILYLLYYAIIADNRQNLNNLKTTQDMKKIKTDLYFSQQATLIKHNIEIVWCIPLLEERSYVGYYISWNQ